jgi:cytochrome b pre-mRNA-processing protein 3
MLNALRKSADRKRAAQRLFAALMARAREPAFYARLGVADTLDGRFDLVALHAWLALKWLEAAHRRELAQALVDVIFVSFDESLRDLGAGDMGLGRKMKAMADAFYGRMRAYDAATGLAEMKAALLRNVYRDRDGVSREAAALAEYTLAAKRTLAALDPDTDLDFGPLPGAAL